LIAVALVASVVNEVRQAERTLLDTAEAELVEERAEPELHELVTRVAAMLDVPKPEVALASADVASGFVVGKSRSRSVVVVSDEMRHRLTPAELEAVVAHELAHISNRDAAVMTVASVPRVVGLELFASDSYLWLWFFLWPIGFLLFAWGSFLSRALSRYREYTADAGSAIITGRPEALMSALQKLTGEVEQIPRQDLRRVEALNPLFIVSVTGHRRWEVFMAHPPLERRLERLASIARQMERSRH
jgi:heat shock protein HtpX